MPRVFVKFKDKDRVPVDAELDHTVIRIVTTAYAKLYPHGAPPAEKDLTVTFESKKIYNLSATVSDANLRDGSILAVNVLSEQVSHEDDGSLDSFKQFLRVSAAELDDNEIVFISVACFDNNHGTESIRLQQCPPSLLRYCLENKIDLNIILVDPAFSDPSLRYRQIYDLPGWRLLHVEDGGRARQYTYTPAVSARACDVWLTVFSAPIPEFSMDLRGRGKILGGMPISDTFASLDGSSSARSGLICGCFAFTPLDKKQYFTMGPKEVIEGAGFEFNP